MHLNVNLNTFAFEWHQQRIRIDKRIFNPNLHNQQCTKSGGAGNKQISLDHYCRAISNCINPEMKFWC